MELKLKHGYLISGEPVALNRTLVELKLSIPASPPPIVRSLNRTLVELKSDSEIELIKGALLLIVP